MSRTAPQHAPPPHDRAQAPPKTLAWNGVSVQGVRRGWAAAEFQACALRLEGRDGLELEPACAAPGSLSTRGHMGAPGRGPGPARPWTGLPTPCPRGGPPHPPRMGPGSVRLPFAWRGKEGGGLGALMHHPDTASTANARFILPTGGPLPEKDAAAATALAVLESLGDHPPEGSYPGPPSRHGPGARRPGTARLLSYPGHFRLTWRPAHRCDLVLDRLGPTDACWQPHPGPIRRRLLRHPGRPAGFFAESPAPEADASPNAQPRPEPDMVQGAGRQGAPLLRRLLRRPWAGVRRGRMWRAEHRRGAPGAFMRGRREADMDAFEAICRDYALDRPHTRTPAAPKRSPQPSPRLRAFVPPGRPGGRTRGLLAALDQLQHLFHGLLGHGASRATPLNR
jgi:hypothetical protein